MAKSDFYKILGVSPTAQPEDIRKAYRTLSKKYHPDLNPDLRLYSDEKMKELVEAYNVLNDVQKRKDYDKQVQFQPRKFTNAGRKASDAANANKAKETKEPSFFEKLLGPFLKPKAPAGGTTQYDPKQADMHFTLGLTMTETEAFYEQAKGEFRLAIKFRPDHKEAYYNLGLMCYKLGEFEEAVVHFQKVLSIDKDDQYARKMVGLLKDDM